MCLIYPNARPITSIFWQFAFRAMQLTLIVYSLHSQRLESKANSPRKPNEQTTSP
jgi:hypothetical protein